jgi:hypothetical protein
MISWIALWSLLMCKHPSYCNIWFKSKLCQFENARIINKEKIELAKEVIDLIDTDYLSHALKVVQDVSDAVPEPPNYIYELNHNINFLDLFL